MSALLIRRSISKIHEVKPNNKYVIIHGCNFLLWTTLFALFAFGLQAGNSNFNSRSSSKRKFYMIVAFLEDLALLYIDCFLMWQVFRYARTNSRSRQQEPDVLKMINVKRLKSEILLTESMRQQQAQQELLNEHLHHFLKQSGLAKRLVQEVGIDFIDFDLPNTEGNETMRIELTRDGSERETFITSLALSESYSEGISSRTSSSEKMEP